MTARLAGEGGPDHDRLAGRVRDRFLAWQCRIRQRSVRHSGGRPSPGMRPRVLAGEPREALAEITVLIVPREPGAIAAELRHMVRRTHDPAERYQNALRFLSAAYYQHPAAFSDRVTALFGPGSRLAARLLAATRCVLEFEEHAQRYRIACAVSDLAEADPVYQATYWHNHLFNPEMPSGVRVLSFVPHWSGAEADPGVEGAPGGRG